jgi:hypothetical protein
MPDTNADPDDWIEHSRAELPRRLDRMVRRSRRVTLPRNLTSPPRMYSQLYSIGSS